MTHATYSGYSQSVIDTVNSGFIDGRTRNALENGILISLGGMAAEAIFSGWRNYRGASRDLERATDHASKLTDDPAEHKAYLNWLYYKACSLLKLQLNWVAVEAVAQRLLEQQQLTGAQIKDIIKEAKANKLELMRQAALSSRQNQQSIKEIVSNPGK